MFDMIRFINRLENKMKNLKIRTKLSLLVIFSLVGLILTGILSLQFMNTINKSSTEFADIWLPSTIAAEEMNTALSDVRTQEYKHVISQNAQEMDSVNKKLDSLVETFNQRYNEYDALVTDDTERKLLQEIRTQFDNYLVIGTNMIELSTENKTDEAMAIMTGESMNAFDALTEKCLELVEHNRAGGEQANRDADVSYAAAQKLMIVILTIISVISVLFALYIVHGITAPVKEIDQVAQKIAEGNLNESIRYQSKDELGVLSANFNKTVTRLRDYVN